MSLDPDSIGGLAKSAGIVLAGTIVANLFALCAEILIPRAMDPTMYGRLGLAYGIITAASSVGVLGAQNGVTRFLSDEGTEHRSTDVLQSGYAISFIGSVIVVVCVYVFRFDIASLMNDARIAPILVVFIPYLLAFPVQRVSVAVLRSQGRSSAMILAKKIGPRVIGLLFAVGFILIGQPVIGAIGFWLASSVLGALFSLYYVQKRIDFDTIISGFPERTTLRDLWSFSWPLAAGTSLFVLLSNVDLIMIGYFLDSAAVGYYRTIQPLRQIITFFTGALSFLYFPLATKHYTQGDLDILDKLYTVTTKWGVSMTFPPVLLFILFSPIVIRLFYGAEYLPAAPVLSILMAGLFSRALVGLDSDTVKAINRPRTELYSAFAGVVVDIGLNSILIPKFGIIGAALGTTTGYVVYNIVEVAVIYRAIGSSPFSGATLKPLVPTTVVGFVILSITSQLSFGLFSLISIGLVLYITQFASMILTRSFTEADILLIKQLQARIGIDLTWLITLTRKES